MYTVKTINLEKSPPSPLPSSSCEGSKPFCSFMALALRVSRPYLYRRKKSLAEWGPPLSLFHILSLTHTHLVFLSLSLTLVLQLTYGFAVLQHFAHSFFFLLLFFVLFLFLSFTQKRDKKLLTFRSFTSSPFDLPLYMFVYHTFSFLAHTTLSLTLSTTTKTLSLTTHTLFLSISLTSSDTQNSPSIYPYSHSLSILVSPFFPHDNRSLSLTSWHRRTHNHAGAHPHTRTDVRANAASDLRKAAHSPLMRSLYGCHNIVAKVRSRKKLQKITISYFGTIMQQQRRRPRTDEICLKDFLL